MYAIVDIAGQQFKVEKDQQVFVHRLEAKEGDKVEFDQVLLIDDKGKVNVGAPAIEGALVSAKVLRHLKGDKTVVFKKKRRKGYKKKQGHRQYFTEIQIDKIAASGAKKTASAKKETPKKDTAKAETKSTAKKETAKKTTAKKSTASDKKTTTSKSTDAKKTTAKKSTAAKKDTAAKKPAATKKPAAKKAAPKKDDKKED